MFLPLQRAVATSGKQRTRLDLSEQAGGQNKMSGNLAKNWRTMLSAGIALGLLCNSWLAQTQEKKAQPTQAPATEQTEVLRINTTLLQVDAIVRDEKGQAITDLRAEDFVIVENGRTYPVEYCSYINLVSERARPSAPTDGRLSRNELGR